MPFFSSSKEDSSDSSLITPSLFQQIADGDKEAFQLLFTQTSSSIYGFLLSIVRNREDAEDLLQETYIRVRLHAGKYSDQGKPLAWMFTIARNLALMRLRESKRSSYETIEDLNLQMDFSQLHNVEDRMVLNAAFHVLEEEERSIVLLHAVNGMKHKEISTILGKPLSTILSKYRRSIKKLKKELERIERGGM